MTLTIFTPVYNRKELLIKLYRSLREQTCKQFVWSIVDDGSTDNLKELVDSFAKESDFSIKYFYQENGGKHSAHNKGVELCETDLFICVDSDDTLTKNAVERILEVAQVSKNQKLLGFFFRKADTNGNISGGAFTLKNSIIGLRDLYHKTDFKGELAIVLYTNLIKDFKFPIFENEKFVSELVLYNRLNSIAKMLWVNEVIYIFEYQESGYTKNSVKLIAKNPYGVACGYLSEAYYSTSFFDKIKNYSRFKAMVSVFELNEQKYVKRNINIFIKVCYLAFLKHYIKLFSSIKKAYY